MKFYTAFRTGDFIEEVSTIDEGIEKIKAYEEEDKADGTFEDGFYEVEDETHHTVYFDSLMLRIDER